MSKSRLKSALFYTERLRAELLDSLAELEEMERWRTEKPPACPIASVEPMTVHGYPVFRFSYDGRLPSYYGDFQYRAKVRDYYLAATLRAYDWSKIDLRFDRAAVFVAHYFKSIRTRDLDNRNRKYLIDALRRTLLIKDDSWHHLMWAERGFLDRIDHVQMFVMEMDNFHDFVKLMNENPKEVVKYPELSMEEMLSQESEEKEREKQIKPQKFGTGEGKVKGFWD